MAESKDSFQEKTEQPTPKRILDARKEGNVAQSQDLGSAAVLMGGILFLLLIGPSMIDQLGWAFKVIYHGIPYLEVTPGSVVGYFRNGGLFMAKMLVPFALPILVIGLLARILQTGWVLSSKSLKPKFSKMNPIKNLKNILGSRGMVELAKGIFKIFIVGLIGYLTIMAEIPRFVMLVDKEVQAIMSTIGIVAIKLGIRIAIAMLLLAILDFMFQKWKHTKDLKMTKQEVKDELKQSEGDPHIKSRIRQIQMRVSLNRMISQMPEADVVVANPTHVAVALKYDPAEMKAPRVIAKGKRKLALRIKSIAREHDIPIIEEPELARAHIRLQRLAGKYPMSFFRQSLRCLRWYTVLKKLPELITREY